MKIKNGFILRKVGDDSVVLPVDSKKVGFNGMIKLNASAAKLWELYVSEHSESDGVNLLLSLGADEETAKACTRDFIAEFSKYEIFV